jgi:DNA-binding transcriptional LysR family regulator
MELPDVEIFVAVVEQGGFTAAAKKLGISKSYASKRLRALEDRLGSALLTRTTRHVAPTVLGEAFYERARAALELLDEAEQLAACEQGTPRGHLKISVPHSFGIRFLAPVLASYQADHPDLIVETSYTDRKVAIVDEGYDVAFRISEALEDSDLLARRVGTMASWVVAAPAYLARRGTPSQPAELADHDALIYTLSPDPRRWRLPTTDGPVTVAVSGRTIADSGDALVEACRLGLGVAIAPDWLVGHDVATGRLVRLFSDTPPTRMGIWAVYPRQRAHSPKVVRLIDRVTAEIEPAPWRTGCDGA